MNKSKKKFKIISGVRKYIPIPIRRFINRIIVIFDGVIIRIFLVNRWLASLYYFLFNRRFDREHIAVLKGRVSYENDLRKIKKSSPFLRRNIHRIEKGLVMQPRRSIFAEEYILETVRIYSRGLNRKGYSDKELKWAKDVLDEYFSVIDDSPVICKARQEYATLKEVSKRLLNDEPKKFKPYPLSACPAIDISFDQLATLFLRRRSVRWYKQKPVPSDLIQQAINAAALAPSACNRQPYRFIVANNSNLATRIAECAGGTSGFAHQLPAIIIVVGDLSAYPTESDRHLIYIDASLASMQLMLAAETLELSTCPINWPDIERNEKKLQNILKLPIYERVIMLIAIGFGDSDGGIPFSQKKCDSFIVQEITEE